ncbi:unnamed protein product, partial [marine sediment metagenome]
RPEFALGMPNGALPGAGDSILGFAGSRTSIRLGSNSGNLFFGINTGRGTQTGWEPLVEINKTITTVLAEQQEMRDYKIVWHPDFVEFWVDGELFWKPKVKVRMPCYLQIYTNVQPYGYQVDYINYYAEPTPLDYGLPDNLLRNPSFEGEYLAYKLGVTRQWGWDEPTGSGSVTRDNAVFHTSGYSMRLTPDALATLDMSSDEPLPCYPGEIWVGSGWIRTDANITAARIYVEFYDAQVCGYPKLQS